MRSSDQATAQPAPNIGDLLRRKRREMVQVGQVAEVVDADGWTWFGYPPRTAPADGDGQRKAVRHD